LWFARPDQFSDEYEGFSTIGNREESRETADIFRRMSVVSCWNHFKSESFPLWKIYLNNSKYGVAIVSTVEKVMESITDQEQKKYINPFAVTYVPPDYDYDGINADIAISRKKNFYQYEDEIRFALNYGGYSHDQGEAVGIEPSRLIEQIITSPYMPVWVEDMIKDVMGKYGLASVPIKPSIVKDTLLK
jgi:hypothetical protein